MSTILKSLKKLEKEKEATRYTVQASGYSGPGSLKASGGASRWTTSAWIRRGIVVVLIIGLGASSLYFYNQSQSRSNSTADQNKVSQLPANSAARPIIETPPQNNPPRTNTRPSVAEQDKRADKIQAPMRNPGIPPAPAKRPIKPQKDPALTASSTPKAKRPVPKDARIPKPAAPPAVSPSRPDAGQQRSPQKNPALPWDPYITPANQDKKAPPAKVRIPVKPTPKKITRTPSNPYSDLRPLSDGRLKVHAIVWSDDQEDRMAVINTQILYEGDSVAGFAVVAIRQDDVVVREKGGGGMWRVIFGRP